MKFYEQFLDILPEFPRTKHIPHKPNAQREDLIATEIECAPIFKYCYVEEKIDGANCGMTLIDGEPIIRNRNHILRKNYTPRTAAKEQFSSIWNWFYKNMDSFRELQNTGPYSVYGEWLYAVHGVKYTKLPDLFIAFDLYDYDVGKFICPRNYRQILGDCGFSLVPLLVTGPLQNYFQLEEYTQEKSEYSEQLKEGVYIKTSDDKYITSRFKMVRRDFIQGEHWSKKVITKNKVQK